VDCDHTTIEHHDAFDLAYVEFTERGNVFDRARMQHVLDHVAQRAQSPAGVTAVVFVHGWKHNARAHDPNIDDFGGLLESVAANAAVSRRPIVGIYVGWRGLSVTAPGIKELSYWERKAAAEQVGRGGVTELLLRLERAVTDDDAPNKNLYLVVGHSFGGAIVLSALNQILLERVVAARPAKDCAAIGSCACVESRPFGHGVVLLNPAIEANQAFQLKQVVSQQCFGPNQVRLMHVISSDADRATNKAFRTGQTLDMVSWKETDLDWQADGRNLRFAEFELDTITVGNFTPFQTGQLCDASLPLPDRRPECRLDGRPQSCLETSSDRRWEYISYVGDEKCVPESDRPQHIPVASNEPLAFIQTDDAFIADHNDVFNNNVIAYLAAIVAEARFKRARAVSGSAHDEHFRPGCITAEQEFEFGPCFEAFQGVFPDEPE
jgi:pimeloyl-ACP methyl ester carboxylesterase